MSSSELTRAPSWSFGPGWIDTRFFPRSSWFDPRCGSDFIDEDLLNRPNMIRQSGSHGRSTSIAKMRGLGEFVMREAEIVGASNQVHSRFQRRKRDGRHADIAAG